MEVFTELMYMLIVWAMGMCTGMGIGTARTYVKLQKQHNAEMYEVEQVQYTQAV